MSHRWLLVAIACASAVANPAAQTPPAGREFVVRLVPAAAPCFSWWQLKSQNRGWGDVTVRWTGPAQFAIPTELDGKPGKSLQISTWCRGYGMSLVDVKELEKSTFSESVVLSPLGEKSISGRVLSAPDGTSLVGASVSVTYSAPWLCEFFQQQDCGVKHWTVASGVVGKDGALRLSIPDFLSDPAVKDRPVCGPFLGAGWLDLRAELHGWLYELQPAEREQLCVRAGYSPMVFQPGPRR